MTREKAADLVLRIGIAVAFLYPPYDALVDPNMDWFFSKFYARICS